MKKKVDCPTKLNLPPLELEKLMQKLKVMGQLLTSPRILRTAVGKEKKKEPLQRKKGGSKKRITRGDASMGKKKEMLIKCLC